jgi:hypothetical protein
MFEFKAFRTHWAADSPALESSDPCRGCFIISNRMLPDSIFSTMTFSPRASRTAIMPDCCQNSL